MFKSLLSSPASENTLDEVSQAKIRVLLHGLFVFLTFAAHTFDTRISFRAVVVVSTASIIAAAALYSWARLLQTRNAPLRARLIQRGASIFSDNLFVTLVLAIGGQSTAGLWTIYLWTSIGYGVRYGTKYLNINVGVSAASFCAMSYLTPFWSDHPPFVLGMLLGMILVPLYTGFLIRQLHRAVADRENAYQARSEFLARMSHELRTPLHAIISTAELLRGKSQSTVENDYVDTIALSSGTLLDLINRVLDLSKFESGQIGLANEKLQIQQLLADVINIFYQQTRSNGIVLGLHIDPEIPAHLLGSPSHIREVLLNIIGNAVKFTDHGSVRVLANLAQESTGMVTVAFEIIDTGCGIPERDLARIFEPFMQSDQSITRKHGGTGLGTSFSQEILRLMGGEISIASVVGLGTTVKFSIPFHKPDELEPDTSASGSNLAVLGSRSASRTILDTFRGSAGEIRHYDNLAALLHALSNDDQAFRIDAVFVDADSYGYLLPAVPSGIFDIYLPRVVPVIGFGDVGMRTVAISAGFTCYFSSALTSSVQRSVSAIVEAFSRKGGQRQISGRNGKVSKSLNILVADDNATNRKIAQIALQEAGHKCTVVSNGDDALFALNDAIYDAALLDMHMPGRDGIEVAKIYRFAGFDREAPIPIILLTADCTSQARDEAESAGISKFLTKPILPSEIVRAVEELVGEYEDDMRDTTDGQALFVSSNVTSLAPETVHHSDDGISDEFLNHRAIAELLALMTKEEQKEFLAEFCEDAAGYIDTLDCVRTARDVDSAREAMHALAGAALIIGANLLAEVARRIEKADAGTMVANRGEFLLELVEVSQRTVEELNKLFSASSGIN